MAVENFKFGFHFRRREFKHGKQQIPPVGACQPSATAVLTKRIPAFLTPLSGLPFNLFAASPSLPVALLA